MVAMSDPRTRMKEAIRQLGGNEATATLLGVSKSAVAHWDKVPARHVLRMSALTEIEPREFRPDLWHGEHLA